MISLSLKFQQTAEEYLWDNEVQFKSTLLNYLFIFGWCVSSHRKHGNRSWIALGRSPR